MTEPRAPYNLEGFAKRVETEKDELDEKISKLSNFIISDGYAGLPINEQVRLRYQLLLMREYSDVLRHRLNNDFR